MYGAWVSGKPMPAAKRTSQPAAPDGRKDAPEALAARPDEDCERLSDTLHRLLSENSLRTNEEHDEQHADRNQNLQVAADEADIGAGERFGDAYDHGSQ